MQSRSRGVSRMRSPIQKPLLRMLWCVSIAPLGKPVVPEVYWMLIMSSKSSEACRSARASDATRSAQANASLQLSIPGLPSPGLEAAPSEVERHEARFPRSQVASGACEPTPDPSPEGNFRGGDEGLLPSWEGSGVGRSMGSGVPANKM